MAVGEWSSPVYLVGSASAGGIYYQYNDELRKARLCMYYYNGMKRNSTYDPIATIPAGRRPKGAVGCVIAPNGYNYAGTLGIRTDGTIWGRVTPNNNSYYWYGLCSWGY